MWVKEANMKRAHWMRQSIFGAAIVLAVSAPPGAFADPVLDPLHGFCTVPACNDLGSNTPTTLSNLQSNTAATFGFWISPANQTGNLYLDGLTPNNQAS